MDKNNTLQLQHIVTNLMDFYKIVYIIYNITILSKKEELYKNH